MSIRDNERQQFENISNQLQQQIQQFKAKSEVDTLDVDLIKDTLRELYRCIDNFSLAEAIVTENLVRPAEISKTAPVTVHLSMEKELAKEEIHAAIHPEAEDKIQPETTTVELKTKVEEVIEKEIELPPAEIAPLVSAEIKQELHEARVSAYAETLSKSAPSTIASRYTKEETLSERIAHDSPQHRLSDTLQQKPLDDLRLSIGLNERFKFINELFEGNQQSFYAAIDKLNNAGSLDQAKAELENLVATYGWQSNHNQVIEFSGLVQRRFTK
jgi:hypothetical protein